MTVAPDSSPGARAEARRAGPSPTEADVRRVLNGIVDPCSAAAGVPAGLVEMGLVHSVHVADEPGGAAVTVTIGLTEPGCLMGIPFVRTAQDRLAALPGVAHVEVSLSPRTDWSPADMSPAYAARLERHRAERRPR